MIREELEVIRMKLEVIRLIREVEQNAAYMNSCQPYSPEIKRFIGAILWDMLFVKFIEAEI